MAATPSGCLLALRRPGPARARAAGLPRSPAGRCWATRWPPAPGSSSAIVAPRRRTARSPQPGGRRAPQGALGSPRHLDAGAGLARHALRSCSSGLAEREAGLAAALPRRGAVHRLPRRHRVSRLLSGGRLAHEPPREPSTKAQGLARPGPLPRDRRPAGADLRQRGQERGVQAPERVQARSLDQDQDRRHRLLDQQGGLLPGARQRPDDRGDDVHREADAARAEQGADRRSSWPTT